MNIFLNRKYAMLNMFHWLFKCIDIEVLELLNANVRSHSIFQEQLNIGKYYEWAIDLYVCLTKYIALCQCLNMYYWKSVTFQMSLRDIYKQLVIFITNMKLRWLASFTIYVVIMMPLISEKLSIQEPLCIWCKYSL